MEIIFIGTGTLVPAIKRQAAGILLNINGKFLLFDSGSGVFYKLHNAGIDYKKIDGLFYTHYEHPDHINDLPFIIFANKYDYPNRENPITITGPEGISNFYENILQLYPVLEGIPFEIKIREIDNDIIKDDNYKISTKPMNHKNAKCCGYRVEANGKSVVYTGDTDYCDEAIELAKNADLLIIECSFPDALKSEGHLTPGLAGKIAKQANVKKLVLTHLYPVCDDSQIMEEAEKEFNNEIIIAEDFLKLHL